MTELRLKATGELLVWYVGLTVDERGIRESRYLAADDAVDSDAEWIALLSPDGNFEVYRHKANDYAQDWDDLTTPILSGPYNDIPAAEHFCESALVEAGVAYYAND